MATTAEAAFDSATRAYERSRVKLGVVASVIVAAIPLVSLGVGGHAVTAMVLGGVLCAAVGGLVWRGEQFALSALSGLKAGVVPLVFSHAANLYGHVCIPGQGCTTLCVPACTLGGLLAGLFVERVARRAAKPNLVRVAGALVAFTTGSLGCACVGSSGMIGLLLGMGVTLVVGRVVKLRA